MKPAWLKIRPPTVPHRYQNVYGTLRGKRLVTVCEEAHCPNMSECWSTGTATFMVLGDTCTRGCRFCAIKTWKVGQPVDPEEPKNLAQAVFDMKLDYVVVTSVDRDDLPDQGSGHFAACIQAIREKNPHTKIEVLIPDFKADPACIKRIVDAKPDVIAHNLETTEPLQRTVRDGRANYSQSLSTLRQVREMDPSIYTKSGIMLGLGETDGDMLKAMEDLRAHGVSILTLGQYLRPSTWHLEVKEYVHPDKFKWFETQAMQRGFMYCASAPFVRSSYRAGELFMKNKLQQDAPSHAGPQVPPLRPTPAVESPYPESKSPSIS